MLILVVGLQEDRRKHTEAHKLGCVGGSRTSKWTVLLALVWEAKITDGLLILGLRQVKRGI